MRAPCSAMTCSRQTTVLASVLELVAGLLFKGGAFQLTTRLESAKKLAEDGSKLSSACAQVHTLYFSVFTLVVIST